MGQSQFLVLIQQLGQAKFCRIFGSGSVNQALTELQTAMFELEAGRPRRFCFSDFIDWWSRGNFGEEASMWPFHSCTCSATEAVSPPGSPSRRNRGPATSTAQTLLARARESAKGAVEVVQVRDEISEVEQISSSSLVGKNSNKPPVSMDLDNNGSRSVKNSVRWEVQEVDPDDLGEGLGSASPKSQKSQKSLEKAERTQKKRKTLHTWLLGKLISILLASICDSFRFTLFIYNSLTGMFHQLPLAITIIITVSILIQALFCRIAVVTIARSERHF